MQLVEAPVYKEIKEIKMEKLKYDVPKVFEESIETILTCLTDLKSKIEIDLKSQKKMKSLPNFCIHFKMK